MVPSTKTNHCLPLASPGDLRTSGYRTLPGGAQGCLDAAGRGVGLGCFEVGFFIVRKRLRVMLQGVAGRCEPRNKHSRRESKLTISFNLKCYVRGKVRVESVELIKSFTAFCSQAASREIAGLQP